MMNTDTWSDFPLWYSVSFIFLLYFDWIKAIFLSFFIPNVGYDAVSYLYIYSYSSAFM